MSSILVSLYMALFYLSLKKYLELSLAVVFFLSVDITVSNSNFPKKRKKSLTHYKLLILQCVFLDICWLKKKNWLWVRGLELKMSSPGVI